MSIRHLLARRFLMMLALVAFVAVARPASAFNCTYATGYVRDAAMRPLAGATVATYADREYCDSSIAVTDASGRYRVAIAGGPFSNGEAIASKNGYLSQTKLVHANPTVPSNGLVAGSNDFTLRAG